MTNPGPNCDTCPNCGPTWLWEAHPISEKASDNQYKRTCVVCGSEGV